jgi:CheY-like chemotaxis protein/anti-sigma regulatory factor (Ser/Thr protein kinase)
VVVVCGMLQNALVNLVLNARDSMPNGGRITIKAENFTCGQAHALRQKNVRPGDYVCISVADTGVGIPQANLEKVFEPFFTTKEVGKGSGLGLSMVYGFVQQSGGTIQIRSSEGYGTVVQLTLPRAADTLSQQPAAHPNAVPQGSETILVVEDHPLVCDFVVAALRGLGYAVLATNDGQTALQCLKAYEGAVHLLFSDIEMPGGMTGWDLAKHAVLLRPSLKVLLTSGYAEAANSRSHSQTDQAMLPKPYSNAELAIAIRKALDLDQARMAS